MTIYIEDNQYAAEVENELRQVVDGDKVLIISPTSSAVPVHGDSLKFFQVTYQPPPTTIGNDLGKDLINKLANHQTVHVFLHGEHPHFGLLVNGNYIVIANEGGGYTHNNEHSPHVDLYVDGTANNNTYPITIESPGCNSTTINEKPYVRLFHELLHAEGLIYNIGHSHSVIIPKVNQFRNQRNLGYQREEPWCFIVSAATGSPTSVAVLTLQGIRNELLRPNSLGGALERHVYAAYMKFSPQVAREIQRSSQLRRVVLEIFVEPFIAFLVLVRDYALDEQDRRQRRQAVEQARARLRERYAASELAELAGLVAAWAGRLRSPAPVAAVRCPECWDAQGVLDYLSASINAAVPGDPYIVWATRPLTAMWEIAADRGPCPEELLIERVHGWVAEMPLPDELRRMPPHAVAESLRQLGQTVLKNAPLRAALARRIAAARGGAVDEALRGPEDRATALEGRTC